MKIKILCLALIFTLFSCKKSSKSSAEQSSSQQSSTVSLSSNNNLSPLVESQVKLSDKDFGKIIELKGTSIPTEKIFKVSSIEMIALDSILIVKNKNDSKMFMVFSLPNFKFIKSFGTKGRGPGEFQYPRLVKDGSGEFLCFIYESSNDKLYSLNKKLEIKEMPSFLKKGERMYSDKQLYGLSSTDFLYVESIKKGKAIFRINSKKDSLNSTLLKKLAFSENHKNWAAYIGDFGANGKKNRLVFAYKYFKQLVFYDLENKTSKVVSFDVPRKTISGNAVAMLAPTNTTHYWGMSSNDKYVYVLYAGRTPIEVSKELKKSVGTIFVEKFDWNGNPISKFKLDHWGHFCVNKAENTIYLVSGSEDQPFLSYTLPKD